MIYWPAARGFWMWRRRGPRVCVGCGVEWCIGIGVCDLVVGEHTRDIVGEWVGGCCHGHGGMMDCGSSCVDWKGNSKVEQGPNYFKTGAPKDYTPSCRLPFWCMWGTEGLG
jgi:hypothetical protein